MSIVAMIEAMERAEIPAEQILAAVKAYSCNYEAEKRERTRQRVAAHRQKKSLKNNDLVTDVTVTSVTSPPPLVPPLEGFPTPLPKSPPIIPPTNTSKRARGYSQRFESLFWQHYPLKENKQAAFIAFQKIQEEIDDDTIAGTVKLYAEHARISGRDYCHATTWLNQRRWENDYSALIADARRSSGKIQGQIHPNGKQGFTDTAKALAAKYRAEAAAEESSKVHETGESRIDGIHGSALLDAKSLRQGSDGCGSLGGGLLFDPRPIHVSADNPSHEGLHGHA